MDVYNLIHSIRIREITIASRRSLATIPPSSSYSVEDVRIPTSSGIEHIMISTLIMACIIQTAFRTSEHQELGN
ncbi:hypothetical protein LshimejAT787_1602220 [Lyophyllum shimeji]|uniref:Uncharacterized protein n=1 Tax=Lyophyllum shimeji TaxID=47721 RepID=A0A9P3UTK8_LYOSH|nr:hypothetical protein LshimejAT787_1602220 [Lyophyllum shimeji]